MTFPFGWDDESPVEYGVSYDPMPPKHFDSEAYDRFVKRRDAEERTSRDFNRAMIDMYNGAVNGR